jgi:hypothetical protein
MIVSASRRTDIPAFYGQWFVNRLKDGFVLVRNPMNPRQVSRIPLEKELIDCIVFWTKNPRNLMNLLDQLEEYRYYFLFTITAYGGELERYLPPKDDVIDTFVELSRRIGKERVVWRYDPILLTGTIDEEYHRQAFHYIAQRLENRTERCIISFLDMYKKCERNLKGFDIKEPNSEETNRLAAQLSAAAKEYGIEMTTCAEEMDLSEAGISHGKCIDDRLIQRITGYPLVLKEDRYQRKTCRCVESIDIGAYNTCPHICLYCYANSDAPSVRRNRMLHNPDSPLLLGEPSPDDSITHRTVRSHKKLQKGLFE